MIVKICILRQPSLNALKAAYQPMIEWCLDQGLENINDFWVNTNRSVWDQSREDDIVEFCFLGKYESVASIFLLKYGGEIGTAH
jgi:hypothetical protein